MSDSVTALEPAVDPNNRISFLLDWELTMKCNLDCSYCQNHIWGGHDNSTAHPLLDECLRSIDFMYEYADLYISTKPAGIRYVILNVYGGEAMHHPDIVEILQTARQRHQERYADRWHLTITTTTNAIVTNEKLQSIIPLIDEFTVSFHTENTDKQKQQFRDNLLTIKSAGRRLKCIVLMHHEQDRFQDAQNMIKWLNDNGIKHLPRQLDYTNNDQIVYDQDQVEWFEELYEEKSYKSTVIPISKEPIVDLSDTGRACCGGRQLCTNQNYKSRTFFVGNKFPDWYCSVNHFFLYVKQVNGRIFVNKDCKMNFDGKVGRIGLLSQAQELLDWTKENLNNHTMPVIQCKKYKCVCGLCAPKAQTLPEYQQIMKKYIRK